MSAAVCPLSSIPVRAEPSDKSEMVTQVLFGEIVHVLETTEKWTKIRCDWDHYIGWVDPKQLQMIGPTDLVAFKNDLACSIEIMHAAFAEAKSMIILLGSKLPDYDGMSFEFVGEQWSFSGQVVQPKQLESTGERLIKIARKYLYTPYLWGGRSPMGIDCSGLTQVCYGILGINLPRDARQQVEEGEIVDFVAEAKPGDLAYFENEEGDIIHVGIVMPDLEILHASGRVRIDRLDHQGIYNLEMRKYTHWLRVIKRVI